VTITGTPGVIARSILRTDIPGEGADGRPTPLRDPSGAPLPKEKNNGELRADLSGLHPNWIWEDSISRDMLIGWAMAFGAAWEVIARDPSFSLDSKRAMREDAAQIARSLAPFKRSATTSRSATPTSGRP
jgi:hypothetical protein